MMAEERSDKVHDEEIGMASVAAPTNANVSTNASTSANANAGRDDKIHDECGVFAVYAGKRQDVARTAYFGIFALQHRGQESCGIAVNSEGMIRGHKDLGTVNDVFTKPLLDALGSGQMAIGHVRYGSRETATRSNAQPMMVNHMKGSMALAMNGAILNAAALRRELELCGGIFHSLSQAEILAAHIIRHRLTTTSIEEAISQSMNDLQGAYTFVAMSPQKLIAVRDPHGVRPLCLGESEDGYIVASESCAIAAVGARFLRDIDPGEIIVIENGKLRSRREHCHTGTKALCVFEYIYFARPDSVVDGTTVHEARRRLGAHVAMAHPAEADVVIGVPDSGIDAAMGYAEASGIPYGLGFIKNKYIGRSFIAPEQEQRRTLVRIKLNPIASTVCGKRVVVVDDSIVRGTTSARFIRILREAGAREIHVRSSSPPFIDLCYYGTDVDSRESLLARSHSADEMARIIGADSLAFLPVEDLEKVVDAGCGGLCDACFTGRYPIDPQQALETLAPRVARPLEECGGTAANLRGGRF